MKVLSLFDGISCGMVALERVGIFVERYVAYEIDENAIKVSKHNYPQIEHCGDVTKEDFTQYKGFDVLIGGSPCQGFSFAGKQLNFNDPRSKLFFEFVDILNHIRKNNPNVKFLLENVGMKKEYEEVITKALGHVPVKINARKVSAQDRKRLYWANFYFTSPKDKNIKASDVIGCECFAGAMRGRRIDENGKRADSRKDLPIVQQIECRKDNKFNCVTTVSKDNVVVFSKERFFPAKENREKWRYLTADEAEKLQTLPARYTDCVSESARIKAIGNGWTVDVIAHIFKGLKEA